MQDFVRNIQVVKNIPCPPLIHVRHPGLIESNPWIFQGRYGDIWNAVEPKGLAVPFLQQVRKELLDCWSVLDDETSGNGCEIFRLDSFFGPEHLGFTLEKWESDRIGRIHPAVQNDVVRWRPCRCCLKRTIRRFVQFFRFNFKGVVDSIACHSHLQRKSPAGIIVRRNRWSSGILPDIRILLFFEECLCIGLVGLGHLDHKRASRVDLAFSNELLLGLKDFHSTEHQDIEHPKCRWIVPLLAGDNKGKRLAFFSFLYRILVHAVKVMQKIFSVKMSCFDQAQRKNELVIHKVSESPPSSRPGIRKFKAFFVIRLGNFCRFDIDRRSDIHWGHFAEQSHNIVEPGCIIAGADPPRCIASSMDNAFESILLQVISHAGAAKANSSPEQGLDIGNRRIHERRDKKSSAGRAHLVFIDVDLRKPVMVEDFGHGFCLREVEHEPVAVVVVSGVMMVKPGHTAAFMFSAHIFPVPLCDHLVTVWIWGGDKQYDDITQDFLGIIRSLSGCEFISQFHRHLRGSHFCRMLAACDKHDGFSFLGEFFCLLGSCHTRISELFHDLPVGIQSVHILLRSDDGHDHRLFQGCGADFNDLDSIWFLVELLEIGLYLVIISHFAVCTHFVPQKFFRRSLWIYKTGKH